MKTSYAILRKAALEFGTPLYVYDQSVIEAQCAKLKSHFPQVEIYYACKANSNPALLKILRSNGIGIEAVSAGELDAAKAAGFPKQAISFTSSSITKEELKDAAVRAGRVHIDSLTQLEAWGKGKMGGEVSLRLNQGIGAGHHSHVITGGPDSKFGITLKDIDKAKRIAKKHGLTITGLEQHIGSNVLDARTFLRAAKVLIDTCAFFPSVTHLDFGGGLGIPYSPNETDLDIERLGTGLTRLIETFNAGSKTPVTFGMEPGRFLVAESGTLLVSVTDLKETSKHQFVGVNSGLNHLIRPALYNSYHRIENISRLKGKTVSATVVGNICESGDVFGRNRTLVQPQVGDILAIHTAGAYGMSMASEYNRRVLPKEVLITPKGLKNISYR